MSNVTAEVRVRPSRTAALESTGNSVVIGAKTFTFSRVHTSTTQRTLFAESVSPLIDHFISGYDCAVLAYGQTGSGKTYTMGIAHGAGGAIVHNALERLYAVGADIRATFIEIYNDEIFDLLGDARAPLHLRQSGEVVSIVGLTEHAPATYAQAIELLNTGCLQRTTKATKMNAESSRSHAVFTVTLRQQRGAAIVESQLAFVDLAGSERLKRTECRGSAAREAIAINSGLLALGNVISALYLKRPHVPYRDSKLTRILARCLGSHLLLIACVSPEQADAFETANTLKYASRAALISQDERVHITSDKDKLAIDQLKREISRLKDENMRLRSLASHRAYESTESVKTHPYVQDLLNTIKRLEIAGRGASVCMRCRKEAGGGDENAAVPIRGATTGWRGAGAAREVRGSRLTNPFEEQQAVPGVGPNMRARRLGAADAKAQNTHFNKTIVAGAEPPVELVKREKMVYFDLAEQRPSASAPDSPEMGCLEPSRGTKSLFTPKKECFSIFPVLVGTFLHKAVSMAPYGEGFAASCADGGVRAFGTRETVLLSESSVRCLETGGQHRGSGWALPQDSILYSCRSLLKLYNSNDRPMPVHAYKSEITALRMFDNLVYTGHEDGMLCALDIRNNAVVFSGHVHRSTVFGIEKLADRVYTCSRDHTVRYVDVSPESGSFSCSAADNSLSPPHYDTVSMLLSYKSMLVSAGRDCSVKTWAAERPFKTVPYAHDAWIRAGAVADRCWATGCKNGVVRFWDLLENSVRCVGKVDAKSPVACMGGAGDQLWVGCQKEIQMYKIANK
ncbi:hypothetical protein PAPHI01_0801 [Pancytospora philotis]|nr:hypothetical protein PAPHI01_0801 [Pancytospora philotis]